MENIQEIFNECNSDSLKLETGEYKGAFVIDRPCIIDGSMSTLWAENGAVLVIKSKGVTIRNLRIEVTGDEKNSDNYYAIETDFPDLQLINVEVKGNIKGISSEPEKWELPTIISFGDFCSNVKNTFTREIISAMDTEISSNIDGMDIQPSHLKKGRNNVRFTINPMKENTILYGEIFIKSNVTRRIYVNGKATLPSPIPKIETKINENDIIYLRKGQRISIQDYYQIPMKFVLETKSDLDIESYAFLLTSGNKVSCDEDLIFFGCQNSADNAVHTGKEPEPYTTITLAKLNPKYEKIAVCFAIYGDNPNLNFSMIKSPILNILGGENEIYRFSLYGLNLEKTVVAVEIYHYKNEWKLSCIGSGYKNGLKKLCQSYGVDVN